MSSFESTTLCPPPGTFRSDTSTNAALKSIGLPASRAASNLPPATTWSSIGMSTTTTTANIQRARKEEPTRRALKSPRKAGRSAQVAKSSSISLNSTMICNHHNHVLRGIRSPSMSPSTVGRGGIQPVVRQQQPPPREGPVGGVKSPPMVLDELDGRGRRSCDNLLRDDPPLSSTLPENTNSLLPGDLSPYIMGEERSNGATMMSEENSNDASSIFSSGLSRGAWEPGAFGLLAQIDDSTLHSPPQPTATTQETAPAPSLSTANCAEAGRPPNGPYSGVVREKQQIATRRIATQKPSEPKPRRQKGAPVAPDPHHPLNDDSPSSSCSSSNSSARTTASSLACKLELESILSASAADPTLANRPVGAVLAEAGVGAEFNSVSRLKSFRPYNRHRRSSGRDGEDLTGGNALLTSETTHSLNGGDTIGGRMKSEGASKVHKSAATSHKGPHHQKQKSGSARRTSHVPATIPCSYKGCEKMFATKGSMRKHLQIHGPRQHSCAICQRSFIERSKLKRHLLVHSGEKPYVCSYPNCGKSFSLDFNLRTHIRSIHTGEKPFECSVCRKSFSQSANLRVHSMLHKRSTANDIDLKRPLNNPQQYQRKLRKNRKERLGAQAAEAEEELHDIVTHHLTA